jgi:hypothetical protein
MHAEKTGYYLLMERLIRKKNEKRADLQHYINAINIPKKCIFAGFPGKTAFLKRKIKKNCANI